MLLKELQPEDCVEFHKIVKQLSPQAELPLYPENCVEQLNNPYKKVYLAYSSSKPVGTISILYESKINRKPIDSMSFGYPRLALAAHIEEVVICKCCRGKGFGKEMMELAIQKARDKGAYKVTLDCSEINIGFYEQCGMKKYEVCMRIDL